MSNSPSDTTVVATPTPIEPISAENKLPNQHLNTGTTADALSNEITDGVPDTRYQLRLRDSLVGMQFLFVAFGALVLVPYLTGLNANVALFTAGAGTLCFQWITRERVPPIFLASSLAFIPAISVGTQQWGAAATASGLIAAGFFYIILSSLIRFYGQGLVKRILPPIVVGPVIISIGLLLAPVAVFMAIGKTGDGALDLLERKTALLISMPTLLTVLLVSLLGRGLLKLFPILAGILVGYISAAILGVIDFSALYHAPWFALPQFSAPEWSWEAVLFVLPIAIAPAVEHIGDMLVISQVTRHNYLQKPGLHKTLLGDGVATILAASVGGPPNTTYSEVTGAVVLTRAYNPAIMTWTAMVAISGSFIGKIGGFLATIPAAVMGGIMLLLFGVIASIGIKTLVNAKVDLDCPRNLAILALTLTFAIGGMTFNFGAVGFSGIGLGAIIGIILNLILPQPRH